MTAITANANIGRYVDQRTRTFDMAASTAIFRNSLVGKHAATGLVGPFVVTNEFAGIAFEEGNNTTSISATGIPASTGTAGAVTIEVETQGDFRLTFAAVTRADIGRAVYAVDSSATVAFTGHALAYMGRVIQAITSTTAIVRLKEPGELPQASDFGSMQCLGGPWSVATGNDFLQALTTDGDGCILTSLLGLGTIPSDDSALILSLDNPNEASNAGVRTAFKFRPDKGLVLKFKVAAYSTSGVVMSGTAVDLEFGFIDALAPLDIVGTYHARFHTDSGDTLLKFGADDNNDDVAEVDTTLDIALTSALAEEYTIIVDGDGALTAYNGVTPLSVPILTGQDWSSVTTLVAGYCHVEKTISTDVAIVELHRFEVYGGR